MENTVVFKGIPGGLRLVLYPDMEWDAVMDAVRAGLKARRSFLGNGSVYFEISGRALAREHKKALMDVLHAEVDMTGIRFDSKEGKRPATLTKNRIIKGTIRNGQQVDCDGDLTVIGDVNPGGQVQAAGNIIILGALRGIAHAGSAGAVSSIVFAMQMAPIQVRIAGYIARPDESDIGPALIYLDDTNVMTIEPIVI